MQNKNHQFETPFIVALVVIVLVVFGMGAFGNIKYPPDNSATTIKSTTTKSGVLDAAQGPINPPPITSIGYVYVLDSYNQRVQKFDSNGNYILQWGSLGTGNGQFQLPEAIAIDHMSGNVYVADTKGLQNIQKFDSNGNYILQWGTHGIANGQFDEPAGIAVDSLGNVYVADFNNNRVQKFTSSGVYISQWGTWGTGNSQFSGPTGIAVDSSNTIYVVDRRNYRIQKFTSSGAYLFKWGTHTGGYPMGIAVDGMNNVYVTLQNNTSTPEIHKFTSSGALLTQWGSYGQSGNGYFSNIYGIATDSLNNVYAGDANNNRVQKFNSTGGYLRKWGSYGNGNGYLNYPSGVAIQSFPDLVVSSLVVDPASLHRNTSSSIVYTFTVTNVGQTAVTIPATAHFGLYKLNTWTQPQLVNDMTNLGVYLIPGGALTVTTSTTNVSAVFSTLGNVTLELRADTTNVVPEILETNNTKDVTVTIVP